MSIDPSRFGEAQDAGIERALWTRAPTEAFHARLEWYHEHVETSLMMTSIFLREFMPSSDGYRAAAIIMNQAFNDWLSLLEELIEGAGRPATRTARTLVEHAVNMADVASSPELAKRYVDHLALAADLQDKARIGIDRLPKKSRRELIHRLRKQAVEAASGIATSVASYGPAWRRAWAPRNLADRASTHGLDSLYSYYRIASLVMHGSAGGSLGSRKDISGKLVYRTGPALQLCPMAYHEGHRAMLAVLTAAEPIRPDLDFSVIKAVVDEFLNRFYDYREAILDTDETAWPTSAPDEPHSVVAIARNGMVRWYWHEPQLGLLFEAQPPVALAPDLQNLLDAKVAEICGNPDEYFQEDSRFVVGELPPPPLAPRKPGGRIVPERALAYEPRAYIHDGG